MQAKVENAGQYLRDKVAVTNAEVAQARKVIAGYQLRQEKAPTLNASLYMPPVPTDPKVLKAYETLARKVLSDGTTRFSEFSRRLMGVSNKKGQEVIGSRLDELFTKNTSETVVAANKAELEAFKEYKATYEAIADFRSTNRIPEFSYPKNAQGVPTGTVSMAKANGQSEFGTNTTIGEKYLGGKNEALRKQGLTEIQVNLGKLKGSRYNDRDTRFLTHAEAESLLKLAQKNGGKLPEEVEIYTDRPTCTFCIGKEGESGRGLSLLAELYGIKKLTIYDSYGTKYLVRPNQVTEVIK